MGKTRSLGGEWEKPSSLQASSYNYPEFGGTISSIDHEQGKEDVLEGLKYGLIFSGIFWVAMIAAGLLIFG